MRKISRNTILSIINNPNYSNSSLLLYLFLNRIAMKVDGELVIEDFSRNSIIEDLKSVVPGIHTGTMYAAFEFLFENNLITYGGEDGSDELILILPEAGDGFLHGYGGFIDMYDFFFSSNFNELRLSTKRVLLYVLHRLGNKNNIKISLNGLLKDLLGLSDLSTKYKILRAITELKIKGIFNISQLDNNVFFFQLNTFSNCRAQRSYIVNYHERHKKKASIIQSIIEKFALSIKPEHLTYIIKALFKRKIKEIEKVIHIYCSTLSQRKNDIQNPYRFVKSLC